MRHEQLASSLDPASTLPLIQGLSHLHEAVLLLDEEGRVLWMSEGLDRACGGADAWVGRSGARLFEGADDGARLLHDLRDGRRVENEPARLRRSEGGPLRVWVSAARLGPAGAR